MTWVFGLAIAFFVAAVAVHWVILRLWTRAPFLISGYGTFGLAAVLAAPVVGSMGLIAVIFFYLSATIVWNLYLIFFINLMNSVSLRLMIEIDAAPDQTLTTEQLLAAYSDDQAFENRLQGLCGAGLLRREGDELVLMPRGRMLAGCVGWIRRLFGIDFFG
ncbi:MAG TPA: hypothetical protein VMV72_19705 [Verrucomicrobiae bacterium]|nr:hypothetical protein [Verrucomicrobiae bacterium]